MAYIHVVTFVKSCKKVRKRVVSVLSPDMLYLKVVAGMSNWLKNTLKWVQKALSGGHGVRRAFKEEREDALFI